jgi:hypothetical protein
MNNIKLHSGYSKNEFIESEENIMKLKALYLEENKTIDEIGEFFNIKGYTLKNYLIKYKIIPCVLRSPIKIKIRELLEQNYEYEYIANLLNVDRSKVKRVAKLIGVHDYEKEWEKKSRDTSKSAKLTKEEKIINTLNKYSELIIEIINNGFSRQEIFKYIPNVTGLHINECLKRLGLYDKWKENVIILRRKQNVINSKKAAKIKSGKAGTGELNKPITEEMIIEFKKYVDLDLYHSDACRLFHTKFKTSARFNDLEEQYGKLKRKPAKFQCGDLNPMFSKSPGDNSGSGISGHIILNGKKIIFRSTLELRIYLYLFDNNIEFNLSNHKIKYIDENGRQSNYHPDIVINETIYEIKPKALIKYPRNVLKFAALTEYCLKYNLKCEYITYETFDILKYNKEYILNLVQKNCILFSEKNFERFKRIKL